MAIATYADYKAKLTNNNRQYIPFTISLNNSTSRPFNSLLNILPAYTAPGAAPGVAPTNNNNGFLPIQPSSGTMHVIGAEFNSILSCTVELVDILSHTSGLSGIVTGLQSTSTAALTRYTDGVGVKPGITIYTALGTTGTTITYNYTNSSDVTNRQAPLALIGASNYNNAGRLIKLPVLDTDIGIKSIQSYQLTATTGTAGSYGFTLYKPLCTFFAVQGKETNYCNLINGGMTNAPEILPNAALAFIVSTEVNSGATTNTIMGRLILAES